MIAYLKARGHAVSDRGRDGPAETLIVPTNKAQADVIGRGSESPYVTD